MRQRKYQVYTDEELIQFAHEGENGAVDFLMEKYKNLVRGKAKTLFLIGGEHDDLIQEGMIGLYKAIRDYDTSKDTSFLSFASLCISRQIYNAIQSQNRKKNQPLNNYISIYTPAYSEDLEKEGETSLVDTMLMDCDTNPENHVINQESLDLLEGKLVHRLSSMEYQVFQLFLEGYKYQKIAEIMGKEPKAIDNALQRIKVKLNQIIQEE